MPYRALRVSGPSPWLTVAAVVVVSGAILGRPVSSEQRWRGGWPRGDDASVVLPEQRSPLPLSALALSTVRARIVFESFRDGENGAPGNWELRIVHADGSNPRDLTRTPDVDEFYPKVSPDGTRIAFEAEERREGQSRSHDVYVMNVDGSGRTKVAENARQPAWSPDGRSLAYLKGEYGAYNTSSWSNRGLEFVDLRTRTVTPHVNASLRLLFNLGWSPDGQWFVATSRGGGRENVAFRVHDTTLVGLPIHGCRPDISPDGSRVAWGRTDWDLDVARLDLGTEVPTIAESKAVVACERGYKVYHADWSPDGRFLAFSYGPAIGDQAVGRKAPGWDICVVDLASGRWARITSDGSHNKEPDWITVRS